MVRVEVVDSEGRLVPTADHEIAFTVTGGRLLGVGNGDPSSHESDRGPTRRAFNGLCMAIVQSTGKAGDLKIDASAKGLTGASVTVVCEPVG
jgi:beta-galactosidase